jgi:hypothetical protein
MPVSTSSEENGEKRGAKSAGDSTSNSKKQKTREEGGPPTHQGDPPTHQGDPPTHQEGFTVAERCAKRLAGESEAERYARDNRDLTLGEQVIRCPLIRDNILQHFNPYKLSDLQTVLNLREFFKLLPDVDLKECYFEKAWGFRKDDFWLANWREMSVEEMQDAVIGAHPSYDDRSGQYAYPSFKADVLTLHTKEEILREYWELTYVPWSVYQTGVGGVHVLQKLKAIRRKFGDANEDDCCDWFDPDSTCPGDLDNQEFARLLRYASRAGLDCDSVIDRQIGCRFPEYRCLGIYDDEYWGFDMNKRDERVYYTRIVTEAAQAAAMSGHIDVVDVLASSFWAKIDVVCLNRAAEWGEDAMIDHLVEEYGLDLSAVDGDGWSALHWAARSGRVCTVEYLVEEYDVDIHATDKSGRTALDVAERHGRTECASVLRELATTRPRIESSSD